MHKVTSTHAENDRLGCWQQVWLARFRLKCNWQSAGLWCSGIVELSVRKSDQSLLCACVFTRHAEIPGSFSIHWRFLGTFTVGDTMYDTNTDHKCDVHWKDIPSRRSVQTLIMCLLKHVVLCHRSGLQPKDHWLSKLKSVETCTKHRQLEFDIFSTCMPHPTCTWSLLLFVNWFKRIMRKESGFVEGFLNWQWKTHCLPHGGRHNT